MNIVWVLVMISQVQVDLTQGDELFTQEGIFPHCDNNVLFPTVKTLGGLYGSKRSRAQALIYNVNEQFSPNVHLPWSCSFETFWRDLGENHFPRFLKDGYCVSAACWYGHYLCQPIVYRMSVIRKQFRDRCMDRNLPRDLASEWKMVEVNVTVACICSRQ